MQVMFSGSCDATGLEGGTGRANTLTVEPGDGFAAVLPFTSLSRNVVFAPNQPVAYSLRLGEDVLGLGCCSYMYQQL